MGYQSQKYYAIAVGKEQKITTDWQECFRLTHGHKGSKYEKRNSYEEAELWLREFNASVDESVMNNFEVEQKIIPSFINSLNISNYASVKNKTEVYLSGDQMTTPVITTDIKNNVIHSENFYYNISVSGLISTLDHINGFKKDSTKMLRKGDSRLNNYILLDESDSFAFSDRQNMYLNMCIKVLTILLNHGINSCMIYTDSNYLTKLLTVDIFKIENLMFYDIRNERKIRDLYETCYLFNKIYISYYSGNSVPDKLSFAKLHSIRNNKTKLASVKERESISDVSDVVL